MSASFTFCLSLNFVIISKGKLRSMMWIRKFFRIIGILGSIILSYQDTDPDYGGKLVTDPDWDPSCKFL
jgi:hypothetical protein